MKPKRNVQLILILLIIATGMMASPAWCADGDREKPSTGSASEAGLDGYKIGSGDVLEITTWKEPDFSRDQILVRTDGKITFPLLNDVQAAGRSPNEVRLDIENGLKEYVATPLVTITVKDPASQKFYILGEVGRTGEYPLVKNLTVLQAFSLAGGFTQWASKDEIILLRKEGETNRIIRINYKNIVKGTDLNQNIAIQADDTIIVP